MDWSAFQQLGMTPGISNLGGAAQGGGVLGQIMKQMAPQAAAPPAVPADGSMPPTIGPGAAPPPPVPPLPYKPAIGLPKGGLMGIANGTAQPQGIAGLLQHFMQPNPGNPGSPATGGALNGPPSANAGMIGPPPPTAPMQILPDVNMANQF